MKKWKVIGESQRSKGKSQKYSIEEIIKILLANRGLKTEKEIKEFLTPCLDTISPKTVGIDEKELKKTLQRIDIAIKNNEKIIIYGDYDVDGICGTAILWETLYKKYKNVSPYIPDRFEEGYGLSIKGIQNLESRIEKIGLIITVDNGIVAHEAVEHANKNGIDVIITDHHVMEKKVPAAYSIVHTTKLCGAGVAYLLSQKIKNIEDKDNGYLELVGLATIADLVPLNGANRAFAKFGIEALKTTTRPGLVSLLQVAGVTRERLGVYEVGYIICPRLNAMGRLFSAMDSLRLLCTKDKNRGALLASSLNNTNRERQVLTEETTSHAGSQFQANSSQLKKILFVAHESYNEGIIGLVAAKLVEFHHRPSFVISKGETHSKGSARSITGVNIIEMIRSVSEHVLAAGGHPMAAGFTLETAKIVELQKALEARAEELIDDEMLKRTVTIDMELDFNMIGQGLYDEIQKLSPFGIGNPEPTFVTRNVTIEELRPVGKGSKHLKLRLSHCDQENNTTNHNCIAFGIGERIGEFKVGDKVDIVYTIAEDTWNGNKKLQLKIKDMKHTEAISS